MSLFINIFLLILTYIIKVYTTVNGCVNYKYTGTLAALKIYDYNDQFLDAIIDEHDINSNEHIDLNYNTQSKTNVNIKPGNKIEFVIKYFVNNSTENVSDIDVNIDNLNNITDGTIGNDVYLGFGIVFNPSDPSNSKYYPVDLTEYNSESFTFSISHPGNSSVNSNIFNIYKVNFTDDDDEIIIKIIYQIPYELKECTGITNIFMSNNENYRFNLFQDLNAGPLIEDAETSLIKYKFSILYIHSMSVITEESTNTQKNFEEELYDTNKYYIFNPNGTFHGTCFLNYKITSVTGHTCENFLQLKVCYPTCQTCNNIGYDNDHSCTSCIEGYAFTETKNDCVDKKEYKDNNRVYLNVIENRFHSCYPTCGSCEAEGTAEVNNCQLCIMEEGYKTYKTEYPVDSQCWDLNTFNLKGYYLYGNMLRKCYETCYSCSEGGQDTNNQCDTCDNITYFKVEGEGKNCINKEDLKQEKYSHYFKETLNEIGLNSERGVIYSICDSNCKTCDERANEHSQGCTSCNAPNYIDYSSLIEKGYKNCIDDDALCAREAEGCSLCVDGFQNIKKEFKCKVCSYKRDYYPAQKYKDDQKYVTCYNNETKPSNYLFDPNTKSYKICYETCNTCFKIGDEKDMGCITCRTNFVLIEERKNNCMPKCYFYYYIDLYEHYRCTGSYECPEEAPYLLKAKSKCVKKCSDDSEYKMTFAGECVKECPEGFTEKEDNPGVCEGENGKTENCILSEINSGVEYNNLTDLTQFKFVKDYIEDFPISDSYVSKYISHENLKEKYIILIYKKESCVKELEKNLKALNVQKCINELRKVHHISELLIISATYLISSSPPVITYGIYNPESYEKLSLEPCKSLTDSFKIDIRTIPSVNLRLVEQFSQMGVNVFNPKDRFFNDICFHFSEDGNDYTLKERLENFYQNVSLCESGCKYKDFNLTTYLVECECDVIKDNPKTEVLYSNEMINNLMGQLTTTNIEVLMCYKDIFKLKEYKNNYGGLFILFCFFVQIISYFFVPHNLATIRKDIFDDFVKPDIPGLKKKKEDKDEKKEKKESDNNENNDNKSDNKEKNKEIVNNNGNIAKIKIIHYKRKDKIKGNPPPIFKKKKVNCIDKNDIANDKNGIDKKQAKLNLIYSTDNISSKAKSKTGPKTIDISEKNGEDSNVQLMNQLGIIEENDKNDIDFVKISKIVPKTEKAKIFAYNIENPDNSVYSSNEKNQSYHFSYFDTEENKDEEKEQDKEQEKENVNDKDDDDDNKKKSKDTKLEHLELDDDFVNKVIKVSKNSRNENQNNDDLPIRDENGQIYYNLDKNKKISEIFDINKVNELINAKKIEEEIKNNNNNKVEEFYKDIEGSSNRQIVLNQAVNINFDPFLKRLQDVNQQKRKILHEKKMEKRIKLNFKMKEIFKSNLNKRLIRPVAYSSFLTDDLEEMDYEEACLYDSRGFGSMLCEQIKSRQFTVNTFCVNEKLKPFSMKLIIFLFSISLYGVVNALLFNEDYIKEKKTAKQQEMDTLNYIFDTLKNSMSRIFYTSFVGTVVDILINILLTSDKKMKLAIKTFENNDILTNGLISKSYHSLLFFYKFFILLNTLLMLLFFVYIFCFCSVYHNIQIDWAISTSSIFIIVQSAQLLSSIGLALFRYFGIRCRKEACFKVNGWIAENV